MLPCSVNQLVRVQQFERAIKGESRLPSQLKSVMRIEEIKDTLPCTRMMKELAVDSTGATKACLYWYIEDCLEMNNRQFESAYRAGLFEDSLVFLHRKRKAIVGFGCDKDTEGTSMIMRVVNRKGAIVASIVKSFPTWKMPMKSGLTLKSQFSKNLVQPRNSCNYCWTIDSSSFLLWLKTKMEMCCKHVSNN